MNEYEEKNDETIQDVTEELNDTIPCKNIEAKTDNTCVESENESSYATAENLTDESAACNSQEELAKSEGAAFDTSTLQFDEVFDELNEKLDALSKQFSDRIARSEYEAKIIQNMDSELKTYKDDLYRSLLKPLILELIDLRESILKMSAFYLNKPEGEQAIPNATFADYAEDISDILEKYDVEVIKSISGDDCISGKHKILKTVPTDKESLHKKIAESLSSGYMYNGRVIFAERVNVYKFEESVPAVAENVTDTNASENAEVSESTENTENTEKSETTESITSEQNSEGKEEQ